MSPAALYGMAPHVIVALSVIVLTDTYDTIHQVVESLSRQTIAAEIELVIGCPVLGNLCLPDEARRVLGRIVTMQVPLIPMGAARTALVRAASAPVVVLGETHAFPDQQWATALLAAHAGPTPAVSPGMTNANPRTARSWAGFLMDYGRWLAERPVGEIDEPPAYNASWKRAVLMAMDGRLDRMLEPGGPMDAAVRRDHPAFEHEPSARVAHLNVVKPFAWIAERYWGGRLFGARRCTGWAFSRRTIYFGGSVLVPFIRFVRTRPAVRLASKAHRLPAGTQFAVAAGSLFWAIGEATGYLVGAGDAEGRMAEYELHKEWYA